MIKRKRKINKQELINVRRYTVISNSAVVRHHFPIGTVVEPVGTSLFSFNDYKCIHTGLMQCVYPECII